MEHSINQKALEVMLCMTRQCLEKGMAAHALLEISEPAKLNLLVHDMILRQTANGRLCKIYKNDRKVSKYSNRSLFFPRN